MFIEPVSAPTSQLRRSEIFGFGERKITLLWSYQVLLGTVSYKHLAALRPGPVLNEPYPQNTYRRL